MVFTKKDYEKTIATLQLAMSQLEPKSDRCILCGDSRHWAWECEFNPLRAMHIRNTYLCYCCGKRFDTETAREHFGETEKDPPQCIKRLREELGEHASFVYTYAILTTPTGEFRNKLTEFNILRMQVLHETKVSKENCCAD